MEPKVCEPILKGPVVPVLESLRRFLERDQPRLVSKGPQRALNRRTLDRYHRALYSWSQRALDRVLECCRLLSDSEDPGLVSEGPGIGPRGL